MPSVSYGKSLDEYLQKQFDSGDYGSVMEVVREAIRWHRQIKQTQAEEMEDIRAKIAVARTKPGKRPGKEVTREIAERVKARRGLK